MMPEQIEIRDLKKRLERAESEKKILKKTTACYFASQIGRTLIFGLILH
jgi:hypothetical protein